jgi:RND family efflux transporter MFP subunit
MSSFLLQTPSRQGASLALVAVLTVAVTWLWAHEGHQALPSRGVAVDVEHGALTLSPEVHTALGVQTAEVETRALDERIHAPARVASPWQAHAYATTRVGGKVVRVHVRPGESVQKGQVLAEVESLELETLQLEYRNALEDLRLAEENLRPLEVALQHGSVSSQAVYEARGRQRDSLNSVTLTGRKLLLLGLEPTLLDGLRSPSVSPLRTLVVRSPLAGVVLHADVQPGQVVEPTQHLFEVVDPTQLWIEVEVLARDLSRIEIGQALVVRWPAPSQPTFRGGIEGKGRALHPETRTGVVWTTARPENNVRLLPGLQGQAEVVLPALRPTPVIPAGAVLHEGAERAVLVQVGPRQFERKSVVLGRTAEGWVEVAGGAVYPGDRVMTTGSHELATFLPATVLRLSPEGVRQSGVRVEPVGNHPIEDVVSLTGTVELPPARRAVVGAPLSGTLQRILVPRDQAVRKGEPIAEVAGLEFQNLQLELLRSQLQLTLLEQTLEPLRSLTASGSPALSARYLREVESSTRAARLKRESLRGKFRTLGLGEEQVRNLLDRQQIVDTLPVRAPIDGVLVRFQGALGQVIKAEEPLFEIHDSSGAEVRAWAAERESDRVRIGQGARVRLAEGGTTLDGVVARIEPVVASGDRSLALWIEVKGLPAKLPQGTLARVALVTGESPPVLAVPREAVLSEGSRRYVFVRQNDGRFERRAVEVGRNDDRYVAVSAGLTPNENVAVQGVAELETGYAGLK